MADRQSSDHEKRDAVIRLFDEAREDVRSQGLEPVEEVGIASETRHAKGARGSKDPVSHCDMAYAR